MSPALGDPALAASHLRLIEAINDFRKHAALASMDQYIRAEGYEWLGMIQEHAVTTKQNFAAAARAPPSRSRIGGISAFTKAMGDMLKTPARPRMVKASLQEARPLNSPVAEEDKENAKPAQPVTSLPRPVLRTTRGKAEISQNIQPSYSFSSRLPKPKLSCGSLRSRYDSLRHPKEAAKPAESKPSPPRQPHTAIPTEPKEAPEEIMTPQPAPPAEQAETCVEPLEKLNSATADKSPAPQQAAEAIRDESQFPDASIQDAAMELELPRSSTPPPPSPQKASESAAKPIVAENAGLDSISDKVGEEHSGVDDEVVVIASPSSSHDRLEEKQELAVAAAHDAPAAPALVEEDGTSENSPLSDSRAHPAEKRTLTAYQAKKSLAAPPQQEAAKEVVPTTTSTTSISAPTTTPAPASFKSAFLAKSLRNTLAGEEPSDDTDASSSDFDDAKAQESPSEQFKGDVLPKKRASEEASQDQPASKLPRQAEAATTRAPTNEHDQLMSRIGKFSAKPARSGQAQTAPLSAPTADTPASTSAEQLGPSPSEAGAQAAEDVVPAVTTPPAGAPAAFVEGPTVVEDAAPAQPLEDVPAAVAVVAEGLYAPSQAQAIDNASVETASDSAPRHLDGDLDAATSANVEPVGQHRLETMDDKVLAASSKTADEEMSLGELVSSSTPTTTDQPAVAIKTELASLIPVGAKLAASQSSRHVSTQSARAPLSAMPKFSVNLTGKPAANVRAQGTGIVPPAKYGHMVGSTSQAHLPGQGSTPAGSGSKPKGLFASSASTPALVPGQALSASSGFIPKMSHHAAGAKATAKAGAPSTSKHATIAPKPDVSKQAQVEQPGKNTDDKRVPTSASAKTSPNGTTQRKRDREDPAPQAPAPAKVAAATSGKAEDKKRKVSAAEKQKATGAAPSSKQAAPTPKQTRPNVPPHTKPTPANLRPVTFPTKASAPAASKGAAPPAKGPSVPSSKAESSASSTVKQAASGPAKATTKSQIKPPGNFSSQNPFQAAKSTQPIPSSKAAKTPQPAPKSAQAAAPSSALIVPQEDDESDVGNDTLPSIYSEYSDSDDEEQTAYRRRNEPDWARGEKLMELLRAQEHIDPDEIFGIPRGPVPLEEILGDPESRERIARRPRTSSGNWDNADALSQWEIDNYNQRLNIQGPGVRLSQNPRGILALSPTARRVSPRQAAAAAAAAATSSSAASGSRSSATTKNKYAPAKGSSLSRNANTAT